MTFADRLRRLRREQGLSQNALADLIGISKSSINMYERGEREPGFATLSALCEIFHTDMNDLLGGAEAPKKVPILGQIACGQPIFANEEGGDFALFEGKADFALRAQGDSMIGARIADGDLVFIQKQDMVENGKIAAVVIDDTATLKRVYYNDKEQTLSLVAENPKYAPLVFQGEELDHIKILGQAIAFRSELL
jgi:repressor LexA